MHGERLSVPDNLSSASGEERETEDSVVVCYHDGGLPTCSRRFAASEIQKKNPTVDRDKRELTHPLAQ